MVKIILPYGFSAPRISSVAQTAGSLGALRLQFPDGAVGGDGSAFLGIAIFFRHKSQDRGALSGRGRLNDRRYIGAPASGLALKSNDLVVGSFSHRRPFYRADLAPAHIPPNRAIDQ